jgi:hypothetical protein
MTTAISNDDRRRIPPKRASTLRQFFTWLLLGVGLQLWILLGRTQLGEKRQLLAGFVAVICAILISIIRPARDVAAHLSQRLSNPSPAARSLTAFVITVLSVFYLYATARSQHRDFSPILHDEYAYLIQTKILAAGHLWLPRHKLADFFDSFHLITDRVYASKYGPGTALFYAPAILFHLPTWLTPLLLSGIAVGLIYLLVAELFDGTSGLLAALMLLSLGIFRRTSITIMSQAPMLALALMAMLAFVYWRKRHGARWILLLGVCVGLAAITRPVDALCIALPLAMGVLLELKHLDNRRRVTTIAVGLVGVAPFLLLQAVYNRGVTGDFKTLPWDYYAQRNDAYDTISRKPIDANVRPQSSLPQKQQFFDEFVLPAYRDKLAKSRSQAVIDRTARLFAGPPLQEQEKNSLIYGVLPNPLFITLLPVGLLGLTRRRWIFWLPLPLFILIYANYTFFLPHYAVAIAPAAIINVLGAKKALSHAGFGAESDDPDSSPVIPAFTLVVIALCLTALPQLNPARHDQAFDAPLLRDVDAKLGRIDRPAIVLFKYDPDRSLHEEPVYNTAAAWPDDAPIIRAHDLGDANARLFAYYAAGSPARAVYRYDEKNGSLTFLGQTAELAGRHP